MREILFRGKRLDNGEWVCGYYVHIGPVSCKRAYIIPEYASAIYVKEVVPSTIGMYTGLVDKNGKKIFDGDIVKYTFDMPDAPNATENGKRVRIGRIFFSDWRASFSVTAGRNCSSSMNNNLFSYVRNGNRVEVVGNIHDNPGLLDAQKGGASE